jgi:hypothetical protein
MARKPFTKRTLRLVGLGAVIGSALLAGGCDTPVADHGPAWRMGGAPAAPSRTYADGRDWGTTTQPDDGKTYVYRGGRDPKTGRADIQM